MLDGCAVDTVCLWKGGNSNSFSTILATVSVCKMVRPMLSDRCPVCPVRLSVMLVHCGQTVGWIEMKLDTNVWLGPGHIVLNGDSAPPKGHIPPIFGPCLLCPNYWMNQNATWYEGRPRPRPHCVRWGPSSPAERGTAPPSFRPMSVVAKRSPISATTEYLYVDRTIDCEDLLYMRTSGFHSISAGMRILLTPA